MTQVPDSSLRTSPAFDFMNFMAMTPMRLMPTGPALAQIGEGVRNVAEAQIALGQAIIRANVTIFEACFNRAAIPAERESDRPSVAAHNAVRTTA